MFFRRKKEAPPSFEEQLDLARRRGFDVTPQPGTPSRYRISKLCCAAVIEPGSGHSARFVESPGWLVQGEIAKLVDRGFQKFLVTSDGRSRPALAEQLRAIHQFDAELRQSFRLPSLYNESLGTVSNRYVYDRVEGRE